MLFTKESILISGILTIKVIGGASPKLFNQSFTKPRSGMFRKRIKYQKWRYWQILKRSFGFIFIKTNTSSNSSSRGANSPIGSRDIGVGLTPIHNPVDIALCPAALMPALSLVVPGLRNSPGSCASLARTLGSVCRVPLRRDRRMLPSYYPGRN